LPVVILKKYSVRGRMEQIRNGMGRSEVVQLIGRPPGDYTTREYFPSPGGMRYFGSETWIFDEGEMIIWFDQNGSVTNLEVHDLLHLGPPSLTERILRWARIR
jgi:hypothetical protein